MYNEQHYTFFIEIFERAAFLFRTSKVPESAGCSIKASLEIVGFQHLQIICIAAPQFLNIILHNKCE